MLVTNQTKASQVKIGDTAIFTQYKADNVKGTVVSIEPTKSGKSLKIRFQYKNANGDLIGPVYTLSPNTKMFS